MLELKSLLHRKIGMIESLEIDEEIFFCGLKDLGSKVKKKNVGIEVKYSVIQDFLSITRVTAFKICVYKDRRKRFLTLTDVVDVEYAPNLRYKAILHNPNNLQLIPGNSLMRVSQNLQHI